MTGAQFRKIALSFPEAVEASHMGHPDFRVGGRIFATLGPDESFGVVMLQPEDQAFFMQISGDVFSPAAGAWGQQGSTVITLRHAKPALVRDAVEAAWRRRAPKRLLTQR
jgi:hypothetical protein